MNLRMTLALITMILALGITGCGPTTHEKNKAAAIDRWTAARTGIIYGMAMQQFETGELEKAERSTNQILSAAPDNARFNVLAARIALEQGNLERAYRHLEIAVNSDPRNPEAHYYAGVVFQRWQQYDRALEAYELAFQAEPDHVAPLMAIAEMLVKLNREEEAVARLQEKLVYFEHNAGLRLLTARIMLKQRRVEEALSMFREAYLLNPDDLQLLEQLAMAEYAGGHFTTAIVHLKQLMEEADHANRRDLLKALADCYQGIDQPAKARQIYLKLVDTEATDVDAWIRLGQVASILGDDSRLRQAARNAVSLDPSRYEGYLLVGLFAQKAGRIDQAIGQFERAAQLAPDSPLPLIMKGIALEKTGDLNAAAAAYSAAQKLAPGDPRPKQLLAGLDPQ